VTGFSYRAGRGKSRRAVSWRRVGAQPKAQPIRLWTASDFLSMNLDGRFSPSRCSEICGCGHHSRFDVFAVKIGVDYLTRIRPIALPDYKFGLPFAVFLSDMECVERRHHVSLDLMRN
jgi:hypothetical protein